MRDNCPSIEIKLLLTINTKDLWFVLLKGVCTSLLGTKMFLWHCCPHFPCNLKFQELYADHVSDFAGPLVGAAVVVVFNFCPVLVLAASHALVFLFIR